MLEHEYVYVWFACDCMYVNSLCIQVYAFWSFALFIAFMICVCLHALTSFVCVLICVHVVCMPEHVCGLQVCLEPNAVGLWPVSGSFEGRQSPVSLPTWLVLTADGKILVRLCNDSGRLPELKAHLLCFKVTMQGGLCLACLGEQEACMDRTVGSLRLRVRGGLGDGQISLAP